MVLLGEQGNDVNEYNVGTQAYTTATTWANSTTNSELYALQQALTSLSINRMDKTQLEAVFQLELTDEDKILDLLISEQSLEIIDLTTIEITDELKTILPSNYINMNFIAPFKIDFVLSGITKSASNSIFTPRPLH